MVSHARDIDEEGREFGVHVVDEEGEELEVPVVGQKVLVDEEDEEDAELQEETVNQGVVVDKEDDDDVGDVLDGKAEELRIRRPIVVVVLVGPTWSSTSAHTPINSPFSARCKLSGATTCWSVR